MATATQGWKRGQFLRYMQTSGATFRKETEGYVRGRWGIHKTDPRISLWIVTHLPSGRKLGDATTLTRAKQLADRIEAEFDCRLVDRYADDDSKASRRHRATLDRIKAIIKGQTDIREAAHRVPTP